MLAAAVKVRPADAPEWQRLLAAAWLGGLRLNELTNLSWDAEAPFAVDLARKRPCFRILAEGQKSDRDEVLPMVPALAELLLQTPEDQRHGRVFRLVDLKTGAPLDKLWVSKIVGKIGRKAGVVTNKAEGKYAGLHDLRRGFCTRWAKVVTPPVLRRLARHASVETTLSYYVDLEADALAEDLWARHTTETAKPGAFYNTSDNICPKAGVAADGPASQTIDN